MVDQGSAWDMSLMGFRVPGRKSKGQKVQDTVNPRESWDLGQMKNIFLDQQSLFYIS